ncbi:MAG: ankyrin repeat domain-containing protein [Epsilonproteobacteria bacterium]|nr:ankyrin repeat domain-containing protein [Campylobacterota bacterium]
MFYILLLFLTMNATSLQGSERKIHSLQVEIAIEQEDYTTLEQFIAQNNGNVNVNVDWPEYSMFWLAAWSKKKFNVAQWLLQRGANIDRLEGMRYCNPKTPLRLAIDDVQSLELVQFLVEHGASLTKKGNTTHTHVLLDAGAEKSEEIFLYLVKHSCRPDPQTNTIPFSWDLDERIFYYLEKFSKQPEDYLSPEWLLFHAIGHTDLGLVQKLLTQESPPDLNCKNLGGSTAMHWAAQKDYDVTTQQEVEILRLLISCGLPYDYSTTNQERHTAHEVAQATKFTQALAMLNNRSRILADVNTSTSTPLHSSESDPLSDGWNII